MAERIHILASVKLGEDYTEEFDGMSPEDIAFYFVENLQADFEGLDIEFEMLEVY